MFDIVVTRHPALVAFLREEGLVDDRTPVVTHATAETVAGKHVIGVLPYFLAAEAASFTEATLRLPPELRGQELTVDQVREHLAGLTTYRVEVVSK